MGSSGTLLAFLEDPGAANFLGPILKRQIAAGQDVQLYAKGTGAARLRDMGIAYSDAAEMGSAADAVSRMAPWAVLVGTSENLDTATFGLIAAARLAGIPSVGGVDSAANAAFRFRGHGNDPLAHAPDLLLLTDDLARRNFAALGFPEDRIIVCGHPYYDIVRAAGAAMAAEGQEVVRTRLFPDAGPRPIVVFLGEISDGLNPLQFIKSADYTLAGRGEVMGRTQVVLEEFLDAVGALDTRPYLVLQPHPKNTEEELGAYYGEFDMVGRGGGALETVFAADLVVGMSTSLLVEAALLKRSTLSIVPRALEREWLPTTAAGVTPCLTHRADITQALADGLKDEAADIEGLFPSGATICAMTALERVRNRENVT
jgi:hypothetical protein